VALSNGLSVVAGRLELSASLPVLLQNSQLVSQVAGYSLPTGGRDAEAVGMRGSGQTLGTGGRHGGMSSGTTTADVTYRDEFDWAVGDPLLSASAALFEGSGVLKSLRVRAAAKAPLVGIESGVGTGAWDGGLGGSTFVGLGRTFAFVDVAYWWFGDLPDLALSDGLTYGVGVSRSAFGSHGSVMISYFGASPMIESMARPSSVALGLSFSPRLGRSLSAGVALGLSESSPTVAAYAGWSLRLR